MPVTHQHKMAPHIERWKLAGEPHRMVKRIAIRHQRGGSENTVPMGMRDAVVHVPRKAEIVRVNNESFHGDQKIESFTRKYFLGLARTSFMNSFNSVLNPLSDS